MRKPAFAYAKTKTQISFAVTTKLISLTSLCFRCIDSTIPLLHKSEISSLQSSSVVVQPGLCQIWSESPKTGLLTTRLNYTCGLKTFFMLYSTEHQLETADI